MCRRKFLGGAGIVLSAVTPGLAVETARNYQAANETRGAGTGDDGSQWEDSPTEHGDTDQTEPGHNTLSAGQSENNKRLGTLSIPRGGPSDRGPRRATVPLRLDRKAG